MLAALPLSLQTTRDRIAFVFYSSGIWLSVLGIAFAFFVLSYASQSDVAFYQSPSVTPAALGAELYSSEQFYRESSPGDGTIVSLFVGLHIPTLFLAFALSIVMVASLMVFAGYAIRSHRHEETALT